jgi:hypothetical protein
VPGSWLQPSTAKADVDSIDIEAITAGNDADASATISSQDDVGDLIITVSGGSDLEIGDVSCLGCSSDDIDVSGSTITVDTDSVDGDDQVEDLTTSFSFTIDCDEDESISVSARDDTDDDIQSIDCSAGATATPTGTVTSTPGPAATVDTDASPSTISCSGTSIVTIQVRDEDGDPVPAGTTVTISTTLGTVEPSAGQTTDASGNAFVFLTAPANQGGTATVTAKAGEAEGSTNVTVNCGTANPTATTAPPPTKTTGGGGVISPPNTGDAGLAAGSTSSDSWVAFAGIGLLVVATAGAVGIAKARA